MNERIFAAFLAGICACQAAKWTVIAAREFLRERKTLSWIRDRHSQRSHQPDDKSVQGMTWGTKK